jgi:hypothetical protein
MRERLPDRRRSYSVEVVHAWGVGTPQEIHEPLLVTIGLYDDDRIGEVFIDSVAEKLGRLSQRTIDLQNDVAVTISIALQHGVPIEELRAATARAETNVMGKMRILPATIAGTVLDVLASEQAKLREARK